MTPTMLAPLGATFGARYPGATVGTTGRIGDGTGVGAGAFDGNGSDACAARPNGKPPAITAATATNAHRLRILNDIPHSPAAARSRGLLSNRTKGASRIVTIATQRDVSAYD